MIKLSVTYQTPPDPGAFDAHYLGTHMPLCDKLPGIKRAEVTRFTAGLDGSPPEHYIRTDLVFDSREAMMAALGSPEGQAVVADVANLQGTSTTMSLGTVER